MRMTWNQRLARRLLANEFTRSAVLERADLSAFRGRPDTRVILGVSAIIISYPLGWPAVGLMASLAVIWQEPLVAAIGGPLVYGLSHLVFLGGMALAGATYTRIFLRWAVRKGVEFLARDGLPELLREAALPVSGPLT